MYANVEEISEKFFEKIRDDIRRKASEGRSKYSTYLQINPNLETPKVYQNMKNHKEVSMIGRLRTSSHNLHVEMGRRNGTAREKRLCACRNAVEDEEHFLTKCLMYSDIRQKHDVYNVNVDTILNDEKYIEYIIDLYERRKLVAAL